MNFLRLPDCLICVSRINQAGKGCLICLSRIDHAEKKCLIYLSKIFDPAHPNQPHT